MSRPSPPHHRQSLPVLYMDRSNNNNSNNNNDNNDDTNRGRPSSMSPRPGDAIHHQRRVSSSMSTQMTIRGMRRLERRIGMEEQNQRTASRSLTATLNPPVDLRMLDYVSKYDDNLMCAICRCPYVDPVVLTECDHCFCRECIRQTWAGSAYSPLGPRGDCPSCRTPAKLGPRGATSKILVNLVQDLVVKCPKADEGCEAQVKRGEVQDHVGIYCQYALVACPEEGCERPVARKMVLKESGCQHYGVSCLSCREDMPVAELESHWKRKCPDRQIDCNQCQQPINYRELETHRRTVCPATTIPCPGASLGCTTTSSRTETSTHAKTCPLAKMAPIFAAQTQRLDEQETAQKLMSKELTILRSGFSSLQNLLHTTEPSPDAASADETRIPLLQSQSNRGAAPRDTTNRDFPFPRPNSSSNDPFFYPPLPSQASSYPHLLNPTTPPEESPYSSPHHHLLHLHEALRDEVTRVTTALSDLEGRGSMERLNDNLRIRDEMAFLGARVEGLGRQVCWLTSAQLMRRQGRSGLAGAGAADGEGEVGDGVQGAVDMVGRAVSGIRGAMSGSGGGGGEGSAGARGTGMRRGASEEGRTKL